MYLFLTIEISNILVSPPILVTKFHFKHGKMHGNTQNLALLD